MITKISLIGKQRTEHNIRNPVQREILFEFNVKASNRMYESHFVCNMKLIDIPYLSFLPLQIHKLTLNVRKPSYLGLTTSIAWLLMSWILASPGCQQPWYWLHRICRSFSYLRKDFKYRCHINEDEWHKMQIYVYVPSGKISTQRVKIVINTQHQPIMIVYMIMMIGKKFWGQSTFFWIYQAIIDIKSLFGLA